MPPTASSWPMMRAASCSSNSWAREPLTRGLRKKGFVNKSGSICNSANMTSLLYYSLSVPLSFHPLTDVRRAILELDAIRFALLQESDRLLIHFEASLPCCYFLIKATEIFHAFNL